MVSQVAKARGSSAASAAMNGNGVAKQPHSQPQPEEDASASFAHEVALDRVAVDPEDGEAISAKKNKKKKKKKTTDAVAAPAAAGDSDNQEEADAPAAAVAAAPVASRSSKGAAAAQRESFDPATLKITLTPSLYDEDAYPHAKPGLPNHPKVPFFTAISTYFAFGLLIAVGHFRDFLNRWGFLRTKKSSPQMHSFLTSKSASSDSASSGAPMAPLVSDFEDFYTRRMYHRIESAWNRPIASCPASVMDLMTREREGYGSYFQLTGQTKKVLNLGSYNYLGFGDPNSPTKEAVFRALDQYGVATTSTRGNLGTTVLHDELERLVAHFVGKEASMIFGMGFATNSTGIAALIGKGGLIISDAMNHASIACGARTSGAVIRVFKHNDIHSLEAVIRHAIISGQPKSHRPWTKILILIEGIYSMEGELCPLPEIVALKKKYGCYLFVDEAHSIGAIGKNGKGICEWSGVDPSEVDLLMGTFTKSFGAVGGYIAADRKVIDFLKANSAGSVYSASISPPAVQQVLSAFKIMLHADGTSIGRRKLDTLRENSNYFRRRLQEMGCHVLGDWDSPIVLLMLYHPAKIQSFSEECLKRGLAVVVVGFPATHLNLARVRICLSAGHTREQLDYALMQLEDVADYMGIKYTKRQF